MAQLTYDPTPADQPEFNESEQEALKIGEQAAAAEQQMYAGKFKDAEQLEQAYIELQKKLGAPKEDEVPPTDQGEESPGKQEEEEPQEEVETEVDAPLSDEDAKALTDMMGGEDAYKQILQWAGENLTQEEIQMYDSVVGTGNKNSCYFAMSALQQRYKEAVGNEAPLLSGRAPSDTPDVFRSQAEVVQALGDPRYEKDPAYRQDVFAKLERSNLAY